MSYHPYRLQSIDDERRLLQKMLVLQDRVRIAREKKSRLKATQTSHYTKMFQPITNSLKQLKAPQVVKADTSTSTVEFLPDEKYEPEEKIEPVEEIEPEVVESWKDEDSTTIEDNPGEMYLNAKRSIPKKSRDDGVFGLNVKNNRIGDYTYLVDGNTLHIINKEKQVRSYVIDDSKLWQLLLIMRPKDIGLQLKDEFDRNTSTLNEYIRIVDDLDLVTIADENGIQIRNRAKYLLLSRKGRGFLFTNRKPEFLRKNGSVSPSVVVVPSDKQGLLRALKKSVAELRSGNTSMQNVVVPLAQEAKRLKILPPGLLSPKEMTWVFA